MNGFQKFLVLNRSLLLVGFLIAGALAAWMLRNFSIEAGTDVLLNQADPELAYYTQTRADWQTDEYVIVCCRRNSGWFTPESIGLLLEFARALKSVPYAKSVTDLSTVPLLRNRPAGLFPVPITISDKEGRLDLEKASRELVQHTQARVSMIS